MKKHIPTIIIFTIIIGVIALGIWYSDLPRGKAGKNSPLKQLAKLDVYSKEELSFLQKEGFLDNIDSENMPDNKEQIISLLKSPNLIEQNLNNSDESFEVLATKLNKSNKSYQLAFKLENKSNQSKEFYLIPISEKDQLQFKEIKGLVNNTNLLSINKDDVQKQPLEALYNIKQHKKELNPELAKAYDDMDNNNYKGEPIKIVLGPNSTIIAKSLWEISRGPTSADLKPVYFLVYGSAGGAKEELTILNVHSSPQKGDNWEVEFTVRGMADLKIIPDDPATIDDDEFVGLYCNGEKRNPQILQGDVIYYPNWQCNGIGKVVHYTLTAGSHKLRFEFGDQTSYAYNNPGLVFHSGFETGGIEVWDSYYGSVTIHGDYAHTGNYGMMVDAQDEYVTLSGSCQRVTFYVNVTANTVGSASYFGDFANDIGIKLQGQLGDVDIIVYDQENFIGSLPDAFPVNTWHRISVSLTTSGDIKVYVDGVEKISDTGLSSTSMTQDLGAQEANPGVSVYLDDYASDSTNSTDDLGDIRVLAARPNDEGEDQDTGESEDWQKSGGGKGSSPAVYTEIDNDPPNTTAYNWAEADGVMMRYTVGLQSLSDLGISGATIQAVNFLWHYETDAGGDASYNKITYDQYPTNPRVETIIDDPRDPTWLSGYEADCPSDGDAWTEAVFDGCEMGMSTDDARKDLWWYEAYAMVAYKPYVEMGDPPSISSVEDGPDPIEVGQAITFYVYWSDPDIEGVKLYVCKEDNATSSGCGGAGAWCQNSGGYYFDVPLTCNHTIVSGDVGIDKAYYAFVCDLAGNCSATDDPNQGTFTASAATPTSLKFDGGIKFEGGIIIK